MVSEPLQPPLRHWGFFFNELHALAHRETLISGKGGDDKKTGSTHRQAMGIRATGCLRIEGRKQWRFDSPSEGRDS